MPLCCTRIVPSRGRSAVSPNEAQTVVCYVLDIFVLAAVAHLTLGCQASGHIDFEIDTPALELTTKPSAEEHGQ